MKPRPRRPRAPAPARAAQEEDRAGAPVGNAGAMLLSLLGRFGKGHQGWGVNSHAVAVGEGGIVPRASLAAPSGAPFGGVDRLALKDPLTGAGGGPAGGGAPRDTRPRSRCC